MLCVDIDIKFGLATVVIFVAVNTIFVPNKQNSRTFSKEKVSSFLMRFLFS